MSDAIDKRSKKDSIEQYVPNTLAEDISNKPIKESTGFFEQGIDRGSIRGFRIGDITSQSRTANKSIIVTIGSDNYELLAYKV